MFTMLRIGPPDTYMELRHLTYFLAVAHDGQFVRAAMRLHVAQSALSQQIRTLERELGTELLVRDRRGIRLTPSGEVLQRHATRILAAVEDATTELQMLIGVVVGKLHLGAGAPASPTRLLEAITRFRTAHPGVEVSLTDASTDELLQRLTAGTLDAAVVSRPPQELPNHLTGALITREPFVALVPTGHALAYQRPINLAQLGGAPLVTFKPGSGIRAAVDAALTDAGITNATIAAATMDPVMLVDLVAHALGVALTPKSFAALADDRVTVIPITGRGIHRSLTLAWLRERQTLPALAAFLEIATPMLEHPGTTEP
jgi:DNA-binding transcriptional LysR family regulator